VSSDLETSTKEVGIRAPVTDSHMKPAVLVTLDFTR